MPDAMVTARMSQAKKDAGAAALKQLGVSASSAINQLYDYLIEKQNLPFDAHEQKEALSKEELAAALAFVDSIPQVESDEFDTLRADAIKQRKLIAKGYATAEDFA